MANACRDFFIFIKNKLLNFKAHILLSLLIILASSCEPEQEKSEVKDLFKYFSNDYTERQFTFNTGTGFHITLPTSYTVESYRQFSITNTDNFRDQMNTTYFSVDHFTKADIDYYKKYFSDSLTNNSQDKLELMLNYILNSRASDLEFYTTSLITDLETTDGIKMKIAAVKGSQNTYSNPLYYQYGIFKIDDELFLLQFIVNEEDISFYHQDILTVFKSVRES